MIAATTLPACLLAFLQLSSFLLKFAQKPVYTERERKLRMMLPEG
jgi:hypothetical protein